MALEDDPTEADGCNVLDTIELEGSTVLVGATELEVFSELEGDTEFDSVAELVDSAKLECLSVEIWRADPECDTLLDTEVEDASEIAPIVESAEKPELAKVVTRVELDGELDAEGAKEFD